MIEKPATGEWLRDAVPALAALDVALPDAQRIDAIRALEELKGAAAAAQARVCAAFAASQRAEQAAAGVPVERQGRGIPSQVGLAKRESPARATRYVGWAIILTRELPGTFSALQAGHITEWRAQIVARETAWLSAEHRAQVDAELAHYLERWGDGQVMAAARRAAYRLDPRGLVARAGRAAADRRVTLRPAPDCMAVLSALLPVPQGVAAYAALRASAEQQRNAGDPRGRGQLMADTLVERVTGQATADAVPVTVDLLIGDHALLGAGPGVDEPAHLDGYGPIPAPLARRLVLAAAGSDAAPDCGGGPGDGATEANDTDHAAAQPTAQATAEAAAAARLWLRRVYSKPGVGMVAMDSRSRRFPAALAKFLVLRDQTCRTPWCDAPIRHLDHVHPAEWGGPTSAANGQGLCEACNHAKQAPGWHARPGPGGAGDSVEIETPTGHHYDSQAPDPPRHPRPRFAEPQLTDVEREIRRLTGAA